MRQIKFRGKRIDNGEWVEGCLIIENPPIRCFAGESDNDKDKYLIGKSGFADWNMPRPFTAAEVDPSTVGQFTGLTDKNGKEIYEGDIVMECPWLDWSVNDKRNWHGPYTISFTKDARFAKFDSDNKESAFNLNKDSGYEIIGNIHDKK